MNITQDIRGGSVVLQLNGRFDFSARKIFKGAMDQAMEKKLHVILDLSQVGFVDSSALGLLVISQQNLKNQQIPFSLVNPQTYVKQVLDLANIAKMIPIYQTLEEVPKARASVSA